MKLLTLNAGSWLTRTKWLPPATLAALAAVAITAGKANAQRNFATACTGTSAGTATGADRGGDLREEDGRRVEQGDAARRRVVRLRHVAHSR